MAKKKITNFKTDILLDASGKSKVITRTSRRESKIENSSRKDISIKIISSEIKEDAESIYEIATIRIDAIDGKRSTISDNISPVSYTHLRAHET